MLPVSTASGVSTTAAGWALLPSQHGSRSARLFRTESAQEGSPRE